MPSCRKLIAAMALLASSVGWAQELPPPAPHNVLQLSASASVEAQQDLLSVTLSTTSQDADAAAVQRQLTAAVDAALASLRPLIQPGQLDVRTGRFGLSPRWNRDGRIDGWTGTAEVVVEGRDFPRITQAAAKVQTLVVHGIGFGLSRQEQERAEREAQAAAIQRFRGKADELARSFGFSGYALREVSVGANEAGPVPVRMMAPAAAGIAGQVPVEAGRSTVRVTVSGSVQLR